MAILIISNLCMSHLDNGQLFGYLLKYMMQKIIKEIYTI